MNREKAQPFDLVDELDTPGGDEKAWPPLRTQGDIQREMARVYRAMRTKRIETPHGNGLVQALQYLSKVASDASGEEVLKRIEQLEAGVESRAAH